MEILLGNNFLIRINLIKKSIFLLKIIRLNKNNYIFIYNKKKQVYLW